MKIFIVLLVMGLVFNACDKMAGEYFNDGETISTEVVTGRNLEISFSSVETGGEYAPHHILAVWIEQEDGTFVRSLKVRATERIQYLKTWKKKSNSDKTDAVSGATLTSHTTHTVNWNLQNKDSVTISTGNYKLKLEMTDKNSQGPVGTFTFAYNDSLKSQSYTDENNFKNVQITYSEILQ
jgi:hypothetical protein